HPSVCVVAPDQPTGGKGDDIVSVMVGRRRGARRNRDISAAAWMVRIRRPIAYQNRHIGAPRRPARPSVGEGHAAERRAAGEAETPSGVRLTTYSRMEQEIGRR